MLFCDVVYQWLNTALDCDISEQDFWEMTIAELDRAIQSYKRKKKAQAQEKATFDYILADLIGRSVARTQSAANKMPEISAVYPTLFDAKEIEQKKQEKKMELSILRFKHFTESYNKNFNR